MPSGPPKKCTFVMFHDEKIKTTLYEILERMNCEIFQISSMNDLYSVIQNSGSTFLQFSGSPVLGIVQSHHEADSVVAARSTKSFNRGDIKTADFLNGNSKQLTLDEIEEIHIFNTLCRYDWNCRTAAKQLGIDRTTLYRKMKKYGISKDK